MSKFNHFTRLTTAPVTPPFLVPDAVYLWLLLKQPETLTPARDLPRIEAEAARVVERHIERMARDHGVTDLTRPKKLSPLIADSTVGLVFDQAAAQHAALAGRYPQSYFGDQLPALRADYPELMRIFEQQRDVALAEARAMLRHLLLDAPPDHPLRLLFAAWQFHQEVVVRRRPMSMIPLVSGEAQGDTPSFTPVLQRTGDDEWQLGLAGDAAPVSPKRFRGDIDALLPEIYAAYSDWYKRDQARLERQVGEAAAHIPDHFYIPVYARRLQTERLVRFGEGVSLANLSHNKLFRLTRPAHEQLFYTAADRAVKLALAAAQGQHPPAPDAAEIEAAYLHLLARRGESAELRQVTPEAKMAAPLAGLPAAAWTVVVNGEPKVTVAWLANHPKAAAVVSGAEYPARAVILSGHQPLRLGLAPFSFKTKKPDTADIWSSTTLDEGAPLADEPMQRALSAWAAWVWQHKAGQKKYQPGGKR